MVRIASRQSKQALIVTDSVFDPDHVPDRLALFDEAGNPVQFSSSEVLQDGDEIGAGRLNFVGADVDLNPGAGLVNIVIKSGVLRADDRRFGARTDADAEWNQGALQAGLDYSAGDPLYLPPSVTDEAPNGVWNTGRLEFDSGYQLIGAGRRSVLRAADNLEATPTQQSGFLLGPVADAVAGKPFKVTKGVRLIGFRVDGNSEGQWGGDPMPTLGSSRHGVSLIATQEGEFLFESFNNDGDGCYMGVPGSTTALDVPKKNFVKAWCWENIRNGGMLSAGEDNDITMWCWENQQGVDSSGPKWGGSYDSANPYLSAEFDLEPNNLQLVTRNRLALWLANGFWSALQIGGNSGADIFDNEIFVAWLNCKHLGLSMQVNHAHDNLIKVLGRCTSPTLMDRHMYLRNCDRNTISGQLTGGTSDSISSGSVVVDGSGGGTADDNDVSGLTLCLTGSSGDGRSMRIESTANRTVLPPAERVITPSIIDNRSTTSQQNRRVVYGLATTDIFEDDTPDGLWLFDTHLGVIDAVTLGSTLTLIAGRELVARKKVARDYSILNVAFRVTVAGVAGDRVDITVRQDNGSYTKIAAASDTNGGAGIAGKLGSVGIQVVSFPVAIAKGSYIHVGFVASGAAGGTAAFGGTSPVLRAVSFGKDVTDMGLLVSSTQRAPGKSTNSSSVPAPTTLGSMGQAPTVPLLAGREY